MLRAKRIKTYMWVQSKQRIFENKNMPFYVLHKGDKDAGAIIIKICTMDGRCRAFTQVTNLAGNLEWQSISLNAEPMLESEANKYISKQLNFDPDLWVLEIEDPHGQFSLDETLI